jgi:MFS family permease
MELSPPTSRPPHHVPGFSSRARQSVLEYLSTIALFSRNAKLFLAAACLMAVNFHVFMLFLNLYLKEIGFVEGDIGMVNSSRSIGMTLMAIPAAILISKIKLKPVLAAGAIAFAAFSVGLLTSDRLTGMILWGILGGAAFSMYQVSTGPFFMRNSTPVERTHLFSISFAVWILAGMIGSIVFGELVVWLGKVTEDVVLGYQYALLIGVGLSLFSLVPIAFIKSARPSGDERRIAISRRQLKERWPFYTKVFTVNFLVGMGAGLSIPFLNLYFRNRFGLSADTIGSYYFFVMGTMFIGTLAGPIPAKRYGLVRTVVITQLASIPFMIALAHSFLLPLSLFAYIVRGGLMNMGAPIVTNLAMELADSKEQGLVGALLMLSWNSSWMISTAVGGELIERFGFTVTINVSVILYIVSTLAFHYFFGGIERRNQDQPGWHIPEEVRA